MPELVIKYKNKKTLNALTDFAKYFEFSIVKPEEKATNVTIISGDNTIDTSELETVFTGKKLNAKQLRENAWS
jgi:prolyl-tRNA editing enzyme YbaK/EbsC (Cys-tRNA(Pro) deacylase)